MLTTISQTLRVLYAYIKTTYIYQERAELEAKLLAEQREREIASSKKKKLEDRLKAMEAKLIQGGKLMDKVPYLHIRFYFTFLFLFFQFILAYFNASS
jgi:hypothetical protein